MTNAEYALAILVMPPAILLLILLQGLLSLKLLPIMTASGVCTYILWRYFVRWGLRRWLRNIILVLFFFVFYILLGFGVSQFVPLPSFMPTA